MLTDQQKSAFYHICKNQYSCIYAPRRAGKTFLMQEYLQHRLDGDLLPKEIVVIVPNMVIARDYWLKQFPGIFVYSGASDVNEIRFKRPELIIGDEVFISNELTSLGANIACCGTEGKFQSFESYNNKAYPKSPSTWVMMNESHEIVTSDIISDIIKEDYSIGSQNGVFHVKKNNDTFRFLDLE